MSALPTGGDAIVARWRTGEISPEIAVTQLLFAGAGADLAERLREVGEAELARFAAARREGLAEVAGLIAAGLEPEDGSPEATRALFDRLAAHAPDPAVAAYALGDPETLARATDELVGVIEAWAGVAGKRVLDFGCGTGRVAAALGGQAAHVTGVDLSPGMIAEARRRHGENERLTFQVVEPDGERLGRFDLVLAVDSLPFVERGGTAFHARTLARLAEATSPSGDLLVFNWSYRGDLDEDVWEARRFAGAHGLDLVRSAERPFAIWDGLGFHFRARP